MITFTDLAVMLRMLVTVLCGALAFVALTKGHGHMKDPPNRASMHRYGYNTPPNYDDDAYWCGSMQVRIILLCFPEFVILN
jgi:hypothetical protein